MPGVASISCALRLTAQNISLKLLRKRRDKSNKPFAVEQDSHCHRSNVHRIIERPPSLDFGSVLRDYCYHIFRVVSERGLRGTGRVRSDVRFGVKSWPYLGFMSSTGLPARGSPLLESWQERVYILYIYISVCVWGGGGGGF